MAWDSTKSAPSAQQPEPSTQCPSGYRRAETRHHRIDHPARPREDAQQPDMIAAIPLRHCALRATTGYVRRNPPSLLRTARRNSTPSIHHPDLLRTARRNQAPSRAILHAIRRTDTTVELWPRSPPTRRREPSDGIAPSISSLPVRCPAVWASTASAATRDAGQGALTTELRAHRVDSAGFEPGGLPVDSGVVPTTFAAASRRRREVRRHSRRPPEEEVG